MIEMRKRIIDAADRATAEQWLDLPRIASVEVSSEDPGNTIEAALAATGGQGWRAERPGPQTIRLIFDSPQWVRRIRLQFLERAAERTQEFTLRWASSAREPLHEIVRQHWNFSPDGSSSETEDYRVDLQYVSVLELNINPDVRSPEAIASLSEWRVG
jgi:hypothetical protein